MAHNPYFAAAYRSGKSARLGGISRTSNPYWMAKGTSEHTGWFAGWDDEDRSLRTGEEHTKSVGESAQ